MSAGRIYDKIGKKAKARIMYVYPGGAILKLLAEKDDLTDVKLPDIVKIVSDIKEEK
jgi:hypothetical protein